MKNRYCLFGSLSLILSMLAACAVVENHVIAYQSDKDWQAAGKYFLVLPTDADKFKNPYLEQKDSPYYDGLVEKALADLGLQRVPEMFEADLVVHLDYDMLAIHDISNFKKSTVAKKQPRFERRLHLVAYDADFFKNLLEIPHQVFKVTVYSLGNSSELRKIFPYLLITAKHFIGQNTGRYLSHTIKSSDPEVQKLVANND